jgi:hypothetical protein
LTAPAASARLVTAARSRSLEEEVEEHGTSRVHRDRRDVARETLSDETPGSAT